MPSNTLDFYRSKHGMLYGDYFYKRDSLIEQYKNKEITLQELLHKWQEELKSEKEEIESFLEHIILKILK